MKTRMQVRFFVLSVCFYSTGVFAQVDRGGIVGTVSDSSGAVVPGVAVTVTNLATSQATKLTTDVTGTYTASLLRIGTYSVSAEKEGFQRTVQSNVEVGVNQVVRVNLTLQVGEVRQVVEINGAPPLLQTETSSLGTIETEKRIVDLPLNQRNFIGLAYLSPGANSGQTGANAAGGVFENERANQALSVNGLRVSNNNYLLNGVDNNEFGLGGIIALPPPDAIQEFRTEENSMSAEFGRGGAAVNVVLKSGTNDIRGGVYEFLRNEKLDARNFFSPDKAAFRRNQFGFFLGGPIFKNRTFIFGDYQGTRLRQEVTTINTVPTEAMRRGDFTERGDLIYDPLTTNPDTFERALINPGNPLVIPADRINSVGQSIANLYPLPNLPGISNNLVLNNKRTNDQDSFDIRVDHRLSERDQFFGAYSFGNVDSHRPATLGDLGGDYCCPSDSKNRSHHFGAGWTHSFGPTLLNDLHGGAFRYVINGLPLNFGKNVSQELGIPNSNRPDDPNSSGLTFMEIAGFTPLGDSLWTPEFAVENIFQIADTLSWTRGKHSLKFGVDFRRQQRNFFQETSPRGWYSFDSSYSQDLVTASGGNGLADLLLGIPINLTQDKLQGTYPTRYWDLAGFVQDDFRVTPNLTLNLGLRYEVASPANGRVSNFDLDRALIVTSYGADAVPHAGVKFDKNNWAPRIGFAYSPFNQKKTVIRGAFGIFYSSEANIFDDLGLNPPALSVNSDSFNPGNIPPSGQFINAGFPPDFVFADPNPAVGTVRANGPKRVFPYIMEWNLTLQHELASNWLVQGSYVGTRGIRLWNHESGNLNQPLLPLDSNFSEGNFGRPYYDRLPGLDTIMPLDYPMFDLTYHALQTSVNKRFSGGFNMLASYTFAKNLGTANGNVASDIQNIFDIAAEKGAVQPDIRHRFVVSYVYELPFGKGKRFGSKAGRGVDLFLGGWEISGITVLRSGEAYSAGLSFDPTNTGAGGRPDRIHDPYDFSFDVEGQQALGCSSPGHQTLDCFFNQAAFVVPQLAPGQLFARQFGNAGRAILRGPDQVNFDFAMLKTFRINERHRLQFRTEFFNVFNHPQFGLPGGGVDEPGAAAITSTLPDNERQIQFGLKWLF